MNSSEEDHAIQAWEGEDLDLDGVVGVVEVDEVVTVVVDVRVVGLHALEILLPVG